MERRSSGSVRVFYPSFDTEQLIEMLRQWLPQLQQALPLKMVVLFGSYARGNYTVASDVDLLVVYEGPERPDAYRLVRGALPLSRLELHLYSLSEYEKMKATIERMTRGGRVIYPGP